MSMGSGLSSTIWRAVGERGDGGELIWETSELERVFLLRDMTGLLVPSLCFYTDD